MNPDTGEIRRFETYEPKPEGWVELKESEAVALLRLSPADRAKALQAMRRPRRRHLERLMARELMHHGEAPKR